MAFKKSAVWLEVSAHSEDTLPEIAHCVPLLTDASLIR